MYIEYDLDEILETLREHLGEFDFSTRGEQRLGEFVLTIYFKGASIQLCSFKSNCAWLIVSDLNRISFPTQTEVAEVVAEIADYAGVMLSISSQQERYIDPEKYGYRVLLEDFNPHSDNTVYLYYKGV